MISFSFPDSNITGGRHPRPIAYEDIAITQITSLSPANVRKCVGALVKFEGGPFRQRMDGGSPVAGSSGYLRSDGDEFFFARQEAILFLVVLETGVVSGTLRVTYYG